MTYQASQLLIASLRANGINAQLGSNNELAVLCPHCAKLHANRRFTLFFNIKSDKWQCFRCEPRQAGRSIQSFLAMLNLTRLGTILEKTANVSDDSLIDLRYRLLNRDYL